jgi:iron complex outermembrane recepter protein
VKKLLLLCSTAVAMPAAAFAQSTGTETTEGETIVVTGARTRGVGGVVVPDVPKTRSILTQEILSRQSDGQSILASINLVPGVNYTNTDPYGSAGGNLRIRGFPGNRVAVLWDGLPLNDTGNYAVFGGQYMDQELIDQVSVNLGTTDVDSPTPSAAGGVVSFRTRVPSKDMGGYVKGTIGDFDFHRLYGMFETGEIGPWGTRAFISASDQDYHKFKGPGELKKNQYNARIYQPIGSNGDFFSIAGHWNRNRNNSYNNGLASDYVTNREFDNIDQCARAVPTTGAADNDGSSSTTDTTVPGLAPSTCTNYYNLRINPSNTGNIRGQLKITLADGLTLTADPGYQQTLANGGGTTTLRENDARLRGNSAALGVDLNGDTDILDTIRVYQPSNTRTKRYTFLTSLIWEVTDSQRLRAAYTFDRGHHRQTGEFGKLEANGDTISVWGGRNNEEARVVAADGATLQNRDRLSIAQLQQLSFEYFGEFLDDRLTVTAGLRAPWFRRELNQNCYTSNRGSNNIFGGTTTSNGGVAVTAGNPYCTSQTTPILPSATPTDPFAGAALTPPAFFLPFERTVKYSPLLPSGGVSYDFDDHSSVYASYGKNFSSPSTDNLYRSVVLDPAPETTQSFEAGYRFRSAKVQAQLATYWVNYKNRIVTAQDLDPESPTFGSTVDRNVGDARAYGFDGQVAVKPIKDLSVYGYLSYINSRLKEDILTNVPCVPPATGVCTAIATNTKGAEFVETPKWQWGGRVQQELGRVSVGVQYKHVAKRWSTDDNGRALATSSTNGQTAGTPFILVDAAGNPVSGIPIATNGRTNAYNIFDADVKLDLDGFLKIPSAALRVSVTNIFDKYYFGNITTSNTLSGGPRFSVGAPRTIQMSLSLGI